jgi:hypothetical protein
MTTSKLKFHRKLGHNLFTTIGLFLLTSLTFGAIYTTETFGAKILFSIFGLLFLLGTVFLSYISFIDKRPILEVDEIGIKVIYHQPKYYKWEDINEFFVGTTENTDDVFICLNLKNKSILKDQNLLYSKTTELNQNTGFGDVNIWASILKVPIERLFPLFEKLIHEAQLKERKKIVANFKIYHTGLLQKEK